MSDSRSSCSLNELSHMSCTLTSLSCTCGLFSWRVFSDRGDKKASISFGSIYVDISLISQFTQEARLEQKISFITRQ